MNHYPSMQDVIKLREHLYHTSYDYWIHHTLYTWRWWLLIVAFFLHWYLWWKIVNKKRTYEILLYGLIIALFNVLIDMIGSNRIWWVYVYSLDDVVPSLVSADIALVPCWMMVMYQYFPRGKSFFIASIVFSLLANFVGEHFFIFIGYYYRITWNDFDSIVYYIVISFLSRFIVLKLKPQD